jgi:hypothetical protein
MTSDDAAIYDITHSCLGLFEDLQGTTDDQPGEDGEGNGDEHSPSAKSDTASTDAIGLSSIKGLHNSFIVWIHYTGALSLQSSSLDTRLRGFDQVWSMIDELLQMMLRNLEQREYILFFLPTTLAPCFSPLALATTAFYVYGEMRLTVLCIYDAVNCKRVSSSGFLRQIW